MLLMAKVIKVYRISDSDNNEYKSGLVEDPSQLIDDIRLFEPDEGPLYLYIETMDEDKFKALEEFNGF